MFSNDYPAPVTVYVLLGTPDAATAVRYFIAPNAAVARDLRVPSGGKWTVNGFMPLKALLPCENAWQHTFD